MAATGSESRRDGLRLTLRLRLTLLYGAVFVLAGAGLLTATYALFKSSQGSSPRSVEVRGVNFTLPNELGLGAISTSTVAAGRTSLTPGAGGGGGETTATFVAPGSVRHSTAPPQQILERIQSSGTVQLRRKVGAVVRRANVALRAQQASDASSLLEWSAIALGAVALLSIGLAWWLAGRALRPLRTMNARAREISAESLHQRLGVGDRHDELGELATTFDALLARLEAAFESQRRFVANASHELRTPLTLERTLIEVALADPEASVAALRGVCERVVASTEEQERVLDALLTLARSEGGVGPGENVDLGALVEDALLEREARLADISVQRSLEPAAVVGDRALLERLVGNLIENAIVHNQGDARWIKLATGERDGAAWLRVANSGQLIDPGLVDDLFEPFRRGDGERLGSDGEGLGLGLSIARAVALAHGAQLEAGALPGGGLELELRLTTAGGGDGQLPVVVSAGGIRRYASD